MWFARHGVTSSHHLFVGAVLLVAGIWSAGALLLVAIISFPDTVLLVAVILFACTVLLLVVTRLSAPARLGGGLEVYRNVGSRQCCL